MKRSEFWEEQVVYVLRQLEAVSQSIQLREYTNQRFDLGRMIEVPLKLYDSVLNARMTLTRRGSSLSR